jgi:hypothetical protein
MMQEARQKLSKANALADDTARETDAHKREERKATLENYHAEIKQLTAAAQIEEKRSWTPYACGVSWLARVLPAGLWADAHVSETDRWCHAGRQVFLACVLMSALVCILLLMYPPPHMTCRSPSFPCSRCCSPPASQRLQKHGGCFGEGHQTGIVGGQIWNSRQALKSPHIVGLFCPYTRSLLTLVGTLGIRHCRTGKQVLEQKVVFDLYYLQSAHSLAAETVAASKPAWARNFFKTNGFPPETTRCDDVLGTDVQGMTYMGPIYI